MTKPFEQMFALFGPEVTRYFAHLDVAEPELLFVSEPESQTFVKGQIWAENFVPRAHWEARLPLGIDNFHHPAGTGVIGHHTHWDRCYDMIDCIKEVKKVQDYHMDGNGWWDIGYNFLIGEDGRIYEGRGFHIQGWASQPV